MNIKAIIYFLLSLLFAILAVFKMIGTSDKVVQVSDKEVANEMLASVSNLEVNPIDFNAMDKEYIKRDLARIFNLDRQKSSDFASWIHDASISSNGAISYGEIASIIYVESTFRTQVESHAGAVGPMQVKPLYWAQWCNGDLSNPKDNIECGARVLVHYRYKYCRGDFDCAVQMYNVGPDGFKEADMVMAKKRYLDKVNRALKMISESVVLKERGVKA